VGRIDADFGRERLTAALAAGRSELYLASPQGGVRAQVMTVGVNTGGAVLDVGATGSLFTARMLPGNVFTDHDVPRDRQRFLVGSILG